MERFQNPVCTKKKCFVSDEDAPEFASNANCLFAMLKRLLLEKNLVLAILMSTALVTSCSSPRKDSKFTIGFSQCIGNHLWRKTMLEEMKRELSFHNNVQFLYRNADASSPRQIEQIRDLLRQHIDLLIVSPNEIEPLTPIIDSIYTAGLPVVVIDRTIETERYSAYVGASNVEVGRNAGKYAAAVLKGKGNIVEVTGKPSESPVIDRHRGFMEAIAKYPDMHLVKEIFNSPGRLMQPQLDSLLRVNKDVDLIFGINDDFGRDAYRICRQYGLESRVKVIGVDGLPDDGAGMDMVIRGILVATVLYPTGGQEAINTALNILQGKPYKKQNTLTTTIIDSTNVRIMKLQNQKVVAQQADIDRRQRKIEEQIDIANKRAKIITIISITLALALIFAGITYYYLQENKKITKKLAMQTKEIGDQRNQLEDLFGKLQEATNAKFNFFTNISHEIRTPLTLILGPLEDALASPKLHYSVRHNLELINRNALLLFRLINQLMDFRKMEEKKLALRCTRNNLTQFVGEITTAFNELARRRNVQLSVKNRAADPEVWFDTGMMDKVLFNLLSNAFKFTGEGGTILVCVDRTPDGKEAILRVEDTGVGMVKEDADHAFDLFYQGHSGTFSGTGLGLALSRELIELHHGQIRVVSEKGKGSSFEVRLLTGTAHFAPEQLSTEPPIEVNSYDELRLYTADVSTEIEVEIPFTKEPKESTILIIEDNEDLRKFLQRRLSGKYLIDLAETAEQGLSLAFDTVPDCIISDIILPGKNGLEITEVLKQDIRTSHIPVILLTAKSTMQEHIVGIRSRADAFISKPFNLEYLEETIKNLLKNREVLRDRYTSELPLDLKAPGISRLDRKFTNEFNSIVEKNIQNEALTVDDICREIGISKVQLYRKVKGLLGCNVNDYVLNMRLKKAKYLLKDPQLSIAEVAYQVGFSSQAYFSTVFKSKFMVTPSEYRDNKKAYKG